MLNKSSPPQFLAQISFEMHFNFIFPSMPRSSKGSLPFAFPDQILNARLISPYCGISSTPYSTRMFSTSDVTLIIWNENQLMSLFYSYIAGSLHVLGPQAHIQESSYSCSHNHWFSFCAALFACSVCIQSTRTEQHRN